MITGPWGTSHEEERLLGDKFNMGFVKRGIEFDHDARMLLVGVSLFLVQMLKKVYACG